ncbi:MAG: Outer rane vitamin receptor BtuB [Proteobacteria bacterium]|nr:Outer rane vitamin receptor BtuB [Pseudomonadota bacterium]
MKFAITSLAVPGLLLAFLTTTVAAEGSDADDGKIVVTATRTAQTVDQSLAAVTIISRDDIERMQATDIVELLRTQAGVDVARTGGPGQQTSVFLRGTNSNHVLVLIDGVRASSASTGIFAWQTLDPSQIDRIEIVRGPRTVLYGSDAIGGVIQIFTRRPQGVEARVEAGSFDTRAADAGFSTGNAVRFNANLNTRRTGGYSATNPSAGMFTYNPDKDGSLQNGVTAGLQAQLGKDSTLDAQTWYSTANTDADPDASHSESENRVATVRLRQSLTTNWVQTLAVGNTLDRIDSFDGTGLPSSRITTERISGDWQHDISLNDRSLLSLGVNLINDTGENVDTGTNTLVYDRSTHTAGVFLNWQNRFANQSVNFGVRHDDHSSFGGHSTGQLAWGWDMTPAWRWLAAYGTAFKAPDLSQLYHPGYGGFFAGNPDLTPEVSRSAELGALYIPSPAQRLRVNLFYTNVDDLIAFEGTNSQAINIGKASIRGGELEYSLRLAPWRFVANATVQRAVNEITDADLLRRPHEKLALQLDRGFANKGNVGMEVLAVSSHDDIDNITFDTIEVPGYAILNLVAAYPLTGRWILSARVENLTDKVYENVSGYNTSARAAYVALRYSTGK